MTALHSPFSAVHRFTSGDADSLAGALKAIADPTRLRILALIAERESVTVTELVPELKLTQPSVSHHLATLRDAGLVKEERVGKEVHRTLNVDAVSQLAGLIDPNGGRR